MYEEVISEDAQVSDEKNNERSIVQQKQKSHCYQKLFTQELNSIRFMADRTRQSELFKEKLHRIVLSSRQGEEFAIGASNAITVLNAAGEVFSEKTIAVLEFLKQTYRISQSTD